jgi:hypothetical protein
LKKLIFFGTTGLTKGFIEQMQRDNYRNVSIDYIYIDTNGDLVIELTNLASDEIIEVEIDTSGTIYEVDEL